MQYRVHLSMNRVRTLVVIFRSWYLKVNDKFGSTNCKHIVSVTIIQWLPLLLAWVKFKSLIISANHKIIFLYYESGFYLYVAQYRNIWKPPTHWRNDLCMVLQKTPLFVQKTCQYVFIIMNRSLLLKIHGWSSWNFPYFFGVQI